MLDKIIHIPISIQIIAGLIFFFLIICVPFMLKYKTYFFGWDNFKWLVVELRKMYSNEQSHFSYKRFQMGTAFFMFTQGSMYALTHLVTDISTFLAWATPNLLIAGYTLNKVQQEKKDNNAPNNAP